MSGLDKKLTLGDRSTESRPTEQERWQDRFLLQINQQSTPFDDKEGFSLGQCSPRYLGEESRTGNHNCNDNNINPNLTAGPKTEHIGVASDNEGIIAQAQNLPPNLRPNENAIISSYAGNLGVNRSPSSALQYRNSENNYAKRLPQSGSNYPPGNSLHSFQSNLMDTMSSGSGANFSGPMFRQSKVESPQQQQRYITHSPYSLHSSGTVISPYQNPRNETPTPPPPDPRSLSLPEVLQFAVGRLCREPEKRTEHIDQMQLQKPLEYSDATPPVTVVVEGRSICQRILLEEHSCYESFARALSEMFVGNILALDGQEADLIHSRDYCNLSNAIPGYLIAYEDHEGDLLLAGDLSWKDFVGAAKRIRILPAKNRQSREES